MSTDPRGEAPGRDGLRRARRALPVAAAASALALVAGCGAPPDYQYVASADRSMVVKLPASWKSLDPTALGYAKPTSKQWTAFFDGSGQADPAHFQTKLPISPPDSPVVQLLTVARNGDGPVPPEVLKDALTPGSLHELIKFAKQADLDDASVTDYGVKEDTVETAQATGLRLRSLFSFDVKGITADQNAPDVSVIVDKLALADRQGRHIHVIQIWCSVECYTKNETLIGQIMSSYTVKAQQ